MENYQARTVKELRCYNSVIGNLDRYSELAGLDSSVVIFPCVELGFNVKSKPYTVLGGIGYGFDRNENCELELVKHVGRVVIGDDVWFGSCCCVDQATKGVTKIGKGSKFDNLCHIAHNCQIGKHTGFSAGVSLGGSTVVGDYSFLGLNSTTKPSIKIGSYSLIGAGSVVIKDVPSFEIWAGNPARFLRKNTYFLEKLKDLKGVDTNLTD
jgi:UDP-3-O-[3-hydroxymyristoyl] glucosamine N-acyltransferase